MVGRPSTSNHLTYGWSKDGLETFNQLAKEVSINRKEYGEEFENAFKANIKQEMASSPINKIGKRKRNCVDTYNDLDEGERVTKSEEKSDDEHEQWVVKNLFMV